MADCPRILSANFDKEDSHTLAVYERDGGYSAMKKVLGSVGLAPAAFSRVSTSLFSSPNRQNLVRCPRPPLSVACRLRRSP